MPESHIEDIMTLTSDIFETESNVLLILSQELLDRKPLHNYHGSKVTILSELCWSTACIENEC